MVQKKCPRVVITAPASGNGKTTVVCALLGALQQQQQSVISFKTGPDYIDPMFHRHVLHVPSYNLDSYLIPSRNRVKELLATAYPTERTTAIIEGAMGYYDGIGTTSQASTYDVNTIIEAPTIVVLDGKGAALTMASVLQGMKQFRSDSRIKGFILNNISPDVYAFYKGVLETETGLKGYGCMPRLEEVHIPSRYLGLVTAQELHGLQHTLDVLQEAALTYLDIPGILSLSKTADSVSYEVTRLPRTQDVTIAVAYDEAFCFYYDSALAMLQHMGAELIRFSPIRDNSLPLCHGLYLGGGYPELYASSLEQNDTMKQAIRSAIDSGMPTIAECGGFMYLLSQFSDPDGIYNWVGTLSGLSHMTERLTRFGYVEITTKKESLAGPAGTVLRGHEFHYSDSDCNGTDCTITKAGRNRSWQGYHIGDTLFAGYPHINLSGYPEIGRRFLNAALQYKERRHTRE
ncbi:MAG: cobyrinate a,c-diamide synthase [Megasphaera sp.]|jgi:cobyrinic acid a,c-diamide synthase|nr:cobyrinate a,c-diamide synthase [Megasphaera sp.]